jgi:hypothetical protein
MIKNPILNDSEIQRYIFNIMPPYEDDVCTWSTGRDSRLEKLQNDESNVLYPSANITKVHVTPWPAYVSTE